MTLLITACSKDKCAAQTASAADLRCGTPTEVARAWYSLLARASDLLPASERYSGRGHRHALAAAERHGVRQVIMSAGLGFVRPSDEIPAYELTLKNGERDSILPHLSAPARIEDWWAALEDQSPFSRPLEGEWDGSSLILVALPVEYLQILPPLLRRLPTSAWDKLRVISGASSTALPEALRPYQLPYDARFNGPDSDDRGIGSDFLGRAAGHLLGILANAEGGMLDDHKALVENALKSMRPAERRHGRSLPDDAITAIIRSEIASAGRGSARLLRRFRDELGIACEQKRFQRLYAGVIAEGFLAEGVIA